MVGLSADRSPATLRRRNGWLIAEHRFWMSGGRVVHLPDGALLNRYWDDRAAPRDEAYREDLLLAEANPDRDPTGLWRDVRAAAESGWDFSSRWLADGKTLGSIRTTRLAPVDLNSLVYLMEQTIAQNCRQLADPACEGRYNSKAAARRRAILSHMWNGRFFADYDLDTGGANNRLTAASAWPLFARLAGPAQAKTEAAALSNLVGPGGISTTPVRSGQQWDAPNGWAPLQWIAFEGLRNYGETALAERIRTGWLAAVTREYQASGRLVEKYDVLEQKPGGGGEYPTQDGFGWTNGVTLALMEQP
jgi:alpha,alpha-trehalase